MLTGLRATAIFILLLILFEPVVRFVRGAQERPSVVVLIDESRSAGLHDVGRKRDDDVRAVAALVARRLGAQAQFAIFDGSVREAGAEWSPDSLAFSGVRTDVTRALRWAGNKAVTDGIGAVLMITDGNHNTGESPVYEAGRAGLPVFVIGVGDTTPPKDVALSALIVPATAVVGSPIRVSATVSSIGFAEAPLRVELLQNDVVVASSVIEGLARRDRRAIDMEWTPQSEGLHAVGIRAVPLDGEFTKANNKVVDNVVVRSNKKRLAVIAGAPSADVSFILQVLRERAEFEVASYVMRPGGSFYEGPPTVAALSEAEAIITIGFPSVGCPAAVVDVVKTAVLKKGRSLLWIGGPAVDMTLLRGLDEVLPFMVLSSRPREVQVTVRTMPGAESDPILRLRGDADDAKRWADLSPIFRPEMFVRPVDDARVLASIRVNNVGMDEPLMIARQTGNVRSLALIGHGIFRWKLLSKGTADARGDDSAIDVLSQWMANGIQWLAVRPDEKRVRIRSTRQQYASGENVELVATVRDEAEREVTDAIVKVRYAVEGKRREAVLTSLGGGRYSVSLEVLPPGTYAFEGDAQRAGVMIGKDAGRFAVGDVDIEAMATTVDTVTIAMIASRSNAAWRMTDQANELLDVIERDARLATTAVTKTSETALWSNPLLLALAILLFSLEWFTRKRNALV